MVKKIHKILSIATAIFLPMMSIFAAGDSSIHNPIGPDSMDINQLVAKLLIVVAMVGGVVCVVFIIYAGFLFVFAQGNETKITDAKRTLLWSVVGAAVLLGASVIAQVIKGTVEGVTNIRLPR